MIPDINFWAVLAATVSAMVVGMVWYAPQVLGNTWMRLADIKPGETKGAAAPIITSIVASFVTAWVLAGSAFIAHEFYGGSFLGSSFITALILWAGFTAARFITHDAFDNRPAGLTVLNLAHELVTISVMALIIGLFGI